MPAETVYHYEISTHTYIIKKYITIAFYCQNHLFCVVTIKTRRFVKFIISTVYFLFGIKRSLKTVSVGIPLIRLEVNNGLLTLRIPLRGPWSRGCRWSRCLDRMCQYSSPALRYVVLVLSHVNTVWPWPPITRALVFIAHASEITETSHKLLRIFGRAD